MPGVTDHYADGRYRWWHLPVPSPELPQALADSWLPPSGLALDAGCGLGTEAGHLYRRGWQVAGVDLSPVALAAAGRNHGPGYLRADLLRLPLRSSAFDACLDRGCFHYLPARHRPGYSLSAAHEPQLTPHRGSVVSRAVSGGAGRFSLSLLHPVTTPVQRLTRTRFRPRTARPATRPGLPPAR